MRNSNLRLLTTLSIIFVMVGILIFNSTDIILSINGSNNNISTKHTTEVNSSKKAKKKANLDGYLFLGDSYTVLLQETIEKKNPSAIVLGQIGVQPGYWNENFHVLPDDDKINGVVLLIGVNGVTYNDNLPNKKELIDDLVKKYPKKTIYIEKVFPVGKYFTSADPDDFNNAIKNLITEDGYLKYTKDGLHIRSDKQETFYKNILDAVNNN